MPIDLPRLGLGTYSSDEGDDWADTVSTALDTGYRAVDTAQVYGNEESVGEGIRSSSVDRDDVFLATKTVHVDVPPEPEEVPEAIDGCLDRLGVDAVDLLYVHWPSGIYGHEDVLPAFDEAYEAGKAHNIGLSNFTPELLDEAREVLDAPLAAHQVEMHPLCQQEELVAYAQEHDHWLVAYSPLARGEVFDLPEIEEVAEKHDATPAQTTIAWLLAKDNVAVIPKASSEDHLRDNLAARDIELDEADVDLIDSVEGDYRVVDPDHAPWN
ncbi:aldo/keto reductase [Halococcus sp. IIIV-5B]|uniref:aldo/keto reductase n=1 Tax=Halococcus sp. IIIV-5B TaxID=2321230 RepID=UPI000E73928F|nr:aldo/keto reductase [Halococcus sp. IIIV-5B]RJT02084.1 aldo/keto reductase [Halococcus sp. IIIV-5B]